MTTALTCKTCRHYWWSQKLAGETEEGRCRRYPPVLHPAFVESDVWRFPRVSGHDTCGEHAPQTER